MVGQVLDTYKILEVLGRGGMGVVYKARDTSLEKVVALKVMNPMLVEDTHFLGRFKAEARALGRLQHPNIVNVFAFRHIKPHLFIVMEFVEGGTLTDVVRAEGPQPWQAALPIMRQALRAIGYAHGLSVIHRDLKPRNIMLTTDRQVKITDFGLAKIQAASSETMVATRTGFTGGTLYYMPPEQLEGLLNVDHRGDIYSLGMSFFEMLAGQTPFDKTSSEFKILKAIDAHDFPALHEMNAEIPAGLASIIMRSIERDPGARYQTAEEMAQALDDWERKYQAAPDASMDETVVITSPHHRFAETVLDTSPPPVLPDASARSTVPPKERSSTATAPRPARPATPPPPEKNRSKAGLWGGLAALGVVLAAGVGWFLLQPDPVDGDVPPIVPATLSISSTPTAARVTINDREVGLTPVSDFEVEPGEHRFRVWKSGYALLDTTIAVGAEERASLSFALLSADGGTDLPPVVEDDTPEPEVPEGMAMAELRVQTEPSGATVYLNREPVGTTPFAATTLPAGRYDVEVLLSGYRPYRESVRLRGGGSMSLRPTLTEAQGALRVVVRPFGDIYINGERKARETNAAYTETLREGVHRVRAQHPVLGTWEKQVELGDGDTQEVVFDFRDTYTVTVISSPPAAEIILDGQPTGTYTNKTLSLPPGQHTISVRKDGFEMQGSARSLTLERNLSDPLSFTLRATN